MSHPHGDIYSIVIQVHPDSEEEQEPSVTDDWRLGDITVDWVDFTREKSTDKRERNGEGERLSHRRQSKEYEQDPTRTVPGAAPAMTAHAHRVSKPHKPSPAKRRPKPAPESPSDLSLQPLLGHIPGPNPVDATTSDGCTDVGRGVVHLFRHPPPASVIARLNSPGESSRGPDDPEQWAGEHAEGEDGSLIAILAVPAWMRPADLIEFLGGWVTCLEGMRMIREATTPNRSIGLLKFRDPLQAADFMVIFTGRAFSTLEARETCHPIRIHHLVLHKLDDKSKVIPIPGFPPSVYSSRARELPTLLKGVPPAESRELPSCPVCLERLDSSVTGLVTLPCAHTFDCDCLRKWGDSRCPVCRVSHLLLQSAQGAVPADDRDEATRLTQCHLCTSTENNWMCVVCGVVGCGRYSKGHARRHWKETGHILAMELETQRVWDYNGDNYVHRLIQTRTDGKLVELPSASSLSALPSRPLPLNRPLSGAGDHSGSPSTPGSPSLNPEHTRSDSAAGGPSNNDVEKMSTIEAITLEYSYLLSSQLEAMRQHYEAEAAAQRSHISELEAAAARVRAVEDAAAAAEAQRTAAEAARAKAEARAEKALSLARSLQTNLGAEKSMSEGLSVRVTKLRDDLDKIRAARDEKAAQVAELNETVKDLMFALEAGQRIQDAGGAEGGEGGDLVIVGGNSGKKKKKS